MTRVKLSKPEGHYRIERFPDGRIARMVLHGHQFGCGQEVVANGSMHVLPGRVGIIQHLTEPHTEGHTTDVLEVLFDGESCAFPMKPKDLDLEGNIERLGPKLGGPIPVIAARQDRMH